MMKNKLSFDSVIAKFKLAKIQLPQMLSNDGQKFYLDNFNKQGFQDSTFTPWRPRKNRSNTRVLLVKTGALRRAVSQSKYQATFDKITWRVGGLKYAVFHNTGTDRLPQRKFLGDSYALRLLLKRKIDKQVLLCFK